MEIGREPLIELHGDTSEPIFTTTQWPQVILYKLRKLYKHSRLNGVLANHACSCSP